VVQKRQEIAFVFDGLTIKFSIIGGKPFKLIGHKRISPVLKMRNTHIQSCK